MGQWRGKVISSTRERKYLCEKPAGPFSLLKLRIQTIELLAMEHPSIILTHAHIHTILSCTRIITPASLTMCADTGGSNQLPSLLLQTYVHSLLLLLLLPLFSSDIVTHNFLRSPFGPFSASTVK